MVKIEKKLGKKWIFLLGFIVGILMYVIISFLFN